MIAGGSLPRCGKLSAAWRVIYRHHNGKFHGAAEEGETPPESITIANWVCNDARVRIQEIVKGFPTPDASRHESVAAIRV